MRVRKHTTIIALAMCLCELRAKELNLRLVERRSLRHHPLYDSSFHVFNETMQPQTRVFLAFGVQTREEETIEWVNPSDIHTEAVEVVHVSVQHT